MIVRICAERNCRTRLSIYNSTTLCWEHRRSTARIAAELSGKHVQRDDDWLIRQEQLTDVETWRPHVMSDTFVKGLERRVMDAADREAYASGEWL